MQSSFVASWIRALKANGSPHFKALLPEPRARWCCSTKIKAGPHSSAVIRLQLLHVVAWPGESASPTHLDWHSITTGLDLLCIVGALSCLVLMVAQICSAFLLILKKKKKNECVPGPFL